MLNIFTSHHCLLLSCKVKSLKISWLHWNDFKTHPFQFLATTSSGSSSKLCWKSPDSKTTNITSLEKLRIIHPSIFTGVYSQFSHVTWRWLWTVSDHTACHTPPPPWGLSDWSCRCRTPPCSRCRWCTAPSPPPWAPPAPSSPGGRRRGRWCWAGRTPRASCLNKTLSM